MGNDFSQFPDLDIEEKAVEVSDFWSQHSASITSSEYASNLSVFVSELFVNGSLWSSQTPLEKNCRNLMIYRHPCIVKYVSSWKKHSKFYLILEDVKPLSHILSTQNVLQICIGLHSILKALCFLHEKASVSHNNVCVSSIYLAKDGSWKLGSMEYLCRYVDLTSDYLCKTRISRYSKAVDANEDKHVKSSSKRKDIVDVFAFGVLACEVLRSKKDEAVPHLSSFYEMCKNDLQDIDINKRPTLSSILNHQFFNHDFLLIHSFLIELPLKSVEEKTEFFTSLVDKLKSFDETFVASQLGGLLLSRMVLLNPVAQVKLLPLILCPRTETEGRTDGLFSEDVFKKFIIPKLLEVFCVRDAQIRLMLLTYFTSYINTFSKEELQSCVLPELLVGIKDTNDHLVSITLKALAELVPILGAATVIGGKRAKLFNDGRPISYEGRKNRKNSKKFDPVVEQESISTSIINIEPDQLNTNTLVTDLPERPRPDGEEGETSTEEVEQSPDENTDNWEDWDLNETDLDNTQTNSSNVLVDTNTDIVATSCSESQSEIAVPSVENMSQTTVSVSNSRESQSRKIIPDINELDIKNQVKRDNEDDEFNFFQDMEPVIETSAKFFVDKEIRSNLVENNVKSKLNLTAHELEGNEDGWVDEEW